MREILSKRNLEVLIDRETKRALTSNKKMTQRDILSRLKSHFRGIAMNEFRKHGDRTILGEHLMEINHYFGNIRAR